MISQMVYGVIERAAVRSEAKIGLYKAIARGVGAQVQVMMMMVKPASAALFPA